MRKFLKVSLLIFLIESFLQQASFAMDPEEEFAAVTILQRPNSDDLPIRFQPLHVIDVPIGRYEIDGSFFRRQNVSGWGMRCFFNAAGLDADIELAKLKSAQDNLMIRYMIANEIVSAARNPDQLPPEVRTAINYELYQSQQLIQDSLEESRSDQLVAQSSDGNKQNPSLLPEVLQSSKLKQRGEGILKDLRKRAFSIEAYQAFLKHHIGREEMMVALHDVQGESQDNQNANYTSIDAIAYLNNLGLRIYQPYKGALRLTHQFIPEHATAISYLYHEGVHFQALMLAPLREEIKPGILSYQMEPEIIFAAHQKLFYAKLASLKGSISKFSSVFLSYSRRDTDHVSFVDSISKDLKFFGFHIESNRPGNGGNSHQYTDRIFTIDKIILIGSPFLKQEYEDKRDVSSEINNIRTRTNGKNGLKGIIPLWLTGDLKENFPDGIQHFPARYLEKKSITDTDYFVNFFELLGDIFHTESEGDRILELIESQKSDFIRQRNIPGDMLQQYGQLLLVYMQVLEAQDREEVAEILGLKKDGILGTKSEQKTRPQKVHKSRTNKKIRDQVKVLDGEPVASSSTEDLPQRRMSIEHESESNDITPLQEPILPKGKNKIKGQCAVAHPFERVKGDGRSLDILGEKEVSLPSGKKIRVQQRSSYSLIRKIKDVLKAKPDVPLNVYQAIYQRRLMRKLEVTHEELRNAWLNIKYNLLFDVESLVEKDALIGFVNSPQAFLKTRQDIQQSYFSKLISHIEYIGEFERILKAPHQALSVILKEAQEWIVEKVTQLKEFYQEYLTEATQLAIKAVQQPRCKEKLLKFISDKAIMTGDVMMGSEERFYRVSQMLARTVVSENEKGVQIKKGQGDSVSNHAVSSLPEDNPRLYFKAFDGLHGLKPGNEFMMGSLYDLLHIPHPETGVLLFTNLTHNNNPPSIVMVSEGILGRTGKQVLKENSEFFEALDQQAYEKQVLGAILTDHGDGKADNFICLENPPRLIPIDNEEVFVPILSEDKKGLRIKSILFTLPQMETPLSSYQRSYLNSLTPQWITYMWLREMEKRNQTYQQLEQSLSFQMLKQQYQTVNRRTYETNFQETLFEHYLDFQPTLRENQTLESHCYLFPESFSCEKDKPSSLLRILSLPLQITTRRIQEVVDRIGMMQRIFKDQKTASLQDLLGGIYPLIGAYYQKLRNEQTDPNTRKLNIKGALTFLDRSKDNPEQNEIETFLGIHTPIQGSDGSLTVVERLNKLQSLQGEKEEDPAILKSRMTQEVSQQINEFLLKALTFLSEGYFPVDGYIRVLRYFEKKGLKKDLRGKEVGDLLREFWIKGQRVLSHIPGDSSSEMESSSVYRDWNEAFLRLRLLNPSLDWWMEIEENFLPRGLADSNNTSFLIEGEWMGKRILPSTIVKEIMDKQRQLEKDENLSGRSNVNFYPKEKPLFYFKSYPELPGYEYGATSFMRSLGIQGLPYSDLVIFRPGEKAINITGVSQQVSSRTSSISAATSSNQPSQSPYPVLLTQAVEGDILKKHWDKPLEKLDFEHTSRLIIASMLINPEDGKEDNFILSPDGMYLIPIDNDHVFLPGTTRTKEGVFVKKVNTALQGKTILYCLDEMKRSLLPETIEFIKSINMDLFLKGWLEDLVKVNEKYQNLVSQDELERFFKEKGTILRIPLDPEFIKNLHWKFHELQVILTHQPDLPLIEILKKLEFYIGKRYEEVLVLPHLKTLESRFKEITKNLYKADAKGNHISVLNSRTMMEIMHMPESEIIGKPHTIKQGPTAALEQLVTLITEYQQQEWQSYLEHGREPKAIDGNKSREEQRYIDSLMESKTSPEILAIHGSRRLYGSFIYGDQLTPLLDYEKGTRLKLIDLRYSDNIDTRAVQIISTLSPNLEVLNMRGCRGLRSIQGVLEGEKIQFPTLRRLTIDRCPQLTTLFIEAPRLKLIEASDNPELKNYAAETSLLELQLMRGNITSETLHDIAEFIPNLEVLNLSECSYVKGIQGSKAGEKLLFPVLRRLIINSCPQLKTLFIESPRLELIEASDNPKFQMFSMDTPELEDFEFTRESLNRENLEELSKIRQQKKGIKLKNSWKWQILVLYTSQRYEIDWLCLRNKNIEDVDVKILKAMLPQTQIKGMDLRNNNIGNEGAGTLAAILLLQTQITWLDLRSNKIGDEGVKALTAILPQTKITRLYLGCNNIGIEGARALADILSLSETKITRLNLGSNNIGTEGIRILAAILPQTKIIELDLDDNNIGIEGTRTLAVILPKTEIVRLDLRDNSIGDEGTRTLAIILPKTEIVRLDLSSNSIGDEGMKKLVKVLPQTQIAELVLNNNSIGDEGVRKLVEVLLKTDIVRLDIGGNNISAEGKALLEELKKQKKINIYY